jgi:hypothetical protein
VIGAMDVTPGLGDNSYLLISDGEGGRGRSAA